MKLILILIVALFASFITINAQNCTAITSNGQTIDLTKFTLPNNGSYQYTNPTTKSVYSFNVCSYSGSCLATSIADRTSAICVSTVNAGKNTTVSFGTLGSTTVAQLNSTSQTGAQLQLTGSSCSTGLRKTFINFVCADVKQLTVVSVQEPGVPVQCQITVNVQIPCSSGSSGIGGGWIFIIILFSGAAVYIIFGSVYNWKIKKHSGSEIFPNVSFWRGAGGYIKDGVFYIKGKITGSHHQGGGYTPVGA